MCACVFVCLCMRACVCVNECVFTIVTIVSSGGALVFAVNSLHYLNQSYPSVDVSLNSITDATTNLPLSEIM